MRLYVCNECAPELFLETPTSAGYRITQLGHCRHLDALFAVVEAARGVARVITTPDRRMNVAEGVLMQALAKVDEVSPKGAVSR